MNTLNIVLGLIWALFMFFIIVQMASDLERWAERDRRRRERAKQSDYGKWPI